MAKPLELDLFARSLSGDRRARTELFKSFVRDSSRVRNLGSDSSAPIDFLHDCFYNLLHTGQDWPKEDRLGAWVEEVAAWTALENRRRSAPQAKLRLCAELENTSDGHGLPSYVPPLAGSASPASRIFALLSGPEQIIVRKRVVDYASWDEAAQAADKPITAVGSIFARGIQRIARLCGAPPPLDDDLVPVFERAAINPQAPEGRLISIQLDAAFYQITPEMRKIGFNTSHEARVFALWNIVSRTVPPDESMRSHLDRCHYCGDLLRALTLLRKALLADASLEFRLCPGAYTLANPGENREIFNEHLRECDDCSSERAQVLHGAAAQQTTGAQQTKGAEEAGAKEPSRASARKKVAWATAALLVIGISAFAAHRYAARPAPATITGALAIPDASTPTVTVDPKYRDLVQSVALDDEKALIGALPANRPALKAAVNQLRLGEYEQTLAISSALAARSPDPSAQLLYAMTLLRNQLPTDGYREMLKAEAMPPRDAYRCWIMLQFALMTGNKDIVEREVEHLSADPEYAARAKAILQKVTERG